MLRIGICFQFVILVLCCGRLTAAENSKPASPPAPTPLEKVLLDVQPSGIDAIWPHESAITKLDLDETSRERNLTWLQARLKETIQPAENEWKQIEWILAREPRRRSAFVLGRFNSRDKRISKIEFKSGGNRYVRWMVMTIFSDQLFPNRKMSDEEVRDAVKNLLNVPPEFVPQIDVLSAFTTVDDVHLTYGFIFDRSKKDPENNEPLRTVGATYPTYKKATDAPKYRPLIPSKDREWYSPMRFCIFQGRFSVAITTVAQTEAAPPKN